MKVLRTPDERFSGLPGYDFSPHYVEVPTRRRRRQRCASTTSTRARPRRPRRILLLHGEPSW